MRQPAADAPTCLNCQQDLGFGRPDRKFCSDGCRHDYHNQVKAQDHSEIKMVQGVLKKNHKILKQLLGDEEGVTISRDELIRAGYNFLYHTRTLTTGKGDYVYCYNYGIRSNEDGSYRIVKSFND